MRFSIATIGAVTLGSGVMAQAEQAKNIVGIPVLKEIEEVEGQWKFDACHKVDSAVDGLIWPCASQLRTRVKFCPKSATTAESRIAQRECLCADPSSFLADAVACSECKMQNGLQPERQREHWIKYYKEVDDKYCQPKDVPLSFEQFSTDLNNKMPVPEGGRNFNLHVGKVIDPRAYYKSAKLEVPNVQGAGKFISAKAEAGNNNATVVVSDPLAGQVRVPVFIAVENLPTANDTKTTSAIRPISSAPFRNNTASIRPFSSASTFLTSTKTSSTASSSASLLPATTLAPAPDSVSGPVEEHIIVIDGQRCVVLIMWVIVDCSPKMDAAGNFAIDFKNIGVDKKEPVMMVENGSQFDKIKDAMPDAGKDQKLAEQCKERVGTVAPVVAAPGSSKVALPAEQGAGESSIPSSKKNNGSSGSQPADNQESCPDATEIPKTQNSPSVGSKAGVSAPNGAKPTTGGSPTQKLGSTPAKNSGITPAQNGQPDNEDCICPTDSAASTTLDATEICTKKVKTETDCRALSGEDVRKCLCSEAGFENLRFFDEAIICSRRSGDLRQGEFEAQVFFETKSRYCERKQFGNDFTAAYESVNSQWREARAPTAILM